MRAPILVFIFTSANVMSMLIIEVEENGSWALWRGLSGYNERERETLEPIEGFSHLGLEGKSIPISYCVQREWGSMDLLWARLFPVPDWVQMLVGWGWGQGQLLLNHLWFCTGRHSMPPYIATPGWAIPASLSTQPHSHILCHGLVGGPSGDFIEKSGCIPGCSQYSWYLDGN